MLLVAGIVLSIISLGLFLITAFAEGMSDRQVSAGELWAMQWPAISTLLLAVSCFLARHFLRGHAITW